MKPKQIAVVSLAVAVASFLCWLSVPKSLSPAPGAPERQPASKDSQPPADSISDDRQPVANQATQDATPAKEAPDIESIWSDERVGTSEKNGSLPHDSFGLPLELRPYLHRRMNNARSWGDAAGKDPASGSYVPSLSDILPSLPKGYGDLAKQHEQALAAIVRKYALGAHPIEIEHWRSRLHAYHLAIENGDFVVVDNTAYPMTSEGNQERAFNNKRHLDQLNLGVMNQDYFYITSSSRSRANEVGMYSALIYITRNKYPEPFLLLDEVVKLKQQAEREVREYLGIR